MTAMFRVDHVPNGAMRNAEPCPSCPFAGCRCEWQNDREGDR